MARRISLLKGAALLTGATLALGFAQLGGATQAAAQAAYVCPPGYYYLANYGCYPFGGYTYYAPPPPAYYYPPQPYPYGYYGPQYGLSFRFGGGDHDRGGDHDGGFGHRH